MYVRVYPAVIDWAVAQQGQVEEVQVTVAGLVAAAVAAAVCSRLKSLYQTRTDTRVVRTHAMCDL